MENPQTYSAEIVLETHATPKEIWKALTDPALIKQYFADVEVQTDWQEGSPIIYTGQWEGKAFEDKGTITKVDPEKLLHMTYWTSFSGLEDKPENYQTIKYEIEETHGHTHLVVTHENIPTEEAKEQAEKNWVTVLTALKNLLEK